MKYYAARDLNGLLYLHSYDVKLSYDTSEYISSEYIELPADMFSDLTFEDGPVLVDIETLKLY